MLTLLFHLEICHLLQYTRSNHWRIPSCHWMVPFHRSMLYLAVLCSQNHHQYLGSFGIGRWCQSCRSRAVLFPMSGIQFTTAALAIKSWMPYTHVHALTARTDTMWSYTEVKCQRWIDYSHVRVKVQKLLASIRGFTSTTFNLNVIQANITSIATANFP